MEKSSISEVSAKGKGAYDAFLNLLSLITLGWLAHAFGAVCFQLINKNLGDLTTYIASPSYYGGLLKYGIASLVVIAPVYFLAVNLLHFNYKKRELNHNSGIYKWLTYLMLLVSSLTILGSLITLITNFLNGNYTLPFILKILTVMVIAGMIFGYYLYDMRRKDYDKKDKVSIIFGAVVAVAVIIAIVVGFLNVENPVQSRVRLQDEKTKNALTDIYYFINNSYYSSLKLEEEYELEMILSGYNILDEEIFYRKVSETEYELCAEFKGDSSYSYDYYRDKSIPWFSHQSGRQCYLIDAKKEYEKTYKTIQQPGPMEIKEVPKATAPGR